MLTKSRNSDLSDGLEQKGGDFNILMLSFHRCECDYFKQTCHTSTTFYRTFLFHNKINSNTK